MGKLTAMAIQNGIPRRGYFQATDDAGIYLYVLSSGASSRRLDYR